MRISRRQIDAVCLDLTNKCESMYHIPLMLSFDRDCYQGVTQYDDTGRAFSILIGRKGIISSGLFRQVNDKLFARMLVNVFHEFQHVNQTIMFENEDSVPTVKFLAMSQLATRENKYYYLSTGNYCHFPHEIDAEKHGIQGAYEYLCEAFPDVPAKEHEKLLLSVIEENTDVRSLYYIPRWDYQSLDEVYQAFDEAFQKSKEDRRLYFVGAWRRCADPAFLYMMKPENSALIDEFNNAPNGLECDRLVSRMTVIQDERILDQYPCLSMEDLHPVSRRPVPEIVKEQSEESMDFDFG